MIDILIKINFTFLWVALGAVTTVLVLILLNLMMLTLQAKNQNYTKETINFLQEPVLLVKKQFLYKSTKDNLKCIKNMLVYLQPYNLTHSNRSHQNSISQIS